jgi:hypothetical protein
MAVLLSGARMRWEAAVANAVDRANRAGNACARRCRYSSVMCLKTYAQIELK